MTDLQLGIIGVGHIGSAVLRSVLESGLLPPASIWISCPVAHQMEPFADLGCHTDFDNTITIRNADLILLAVRPGDIPSVLSEIADVAQGKSFLSVAAGVSIDRIKSLLPKGCPVMRAMPNTPLTVGAGATALTIPADVPPVMANAARDIFEKSGVVEQVEESLMAAATSVNGSGPGYFFRIASVMMDCAVEQGISETAARNLVSATMAGAAEMIRRSEESPRELAQNVAVPGGTTEAAFRKMDSMDFDRALREAMLACAARAEELGR